MSKATSPISPLSSTSRKLPTPAFNIGDRVIFNKDRESSQKYYLRQLVRHELKQVRRFRKEHPMLAFNKDQIRQKLRLVTEAHCIEVAGIAPIYGLNLGIVANECYLPGVPCTASPLEYGYGLCFRWTNDQGDTVAYIPTLSIVTEYNLVRA